ncbi:nestin isoform X1 [Pangasianodon hypophthalmus]|uniref:nestin isoform X1 n=1 Tax=Pangasianodon hypophthalmus TaxID=310915 RepID=UPI00230751F2|nr:nestin isoform X1 [Pangasianodon hypophthalmus]
MEISSFQHPISYTGEEKYEMLELNRRLESYLNHVKLLEEDNQLLWGEIQAMRRNQDSGGQRKAQEEALSLARKELQNAWREKDRVELDVSNLLEEIEELNILRQKEKTAQVEAKRKLDESRKVLEDERRMQIWLKEQAAHLEKEVSLQVHVHQEDLAALKSSCAFSKPVLMAPQHSQTLNLQGLGKEYSQRAAQAWHEAADVYQTQMKKLEESLDQTRAHMTVLKQEKKESQLQIQDLAKELESANVKRELMEKNMVQQRQRQNQDLQHLQAHVEALEAEKLDLGEQMGELLVESRNLLQMKMSLSLEVATYRALLDSESLRVNNQSASKRNRTVSLLEGNTKSPGISPSTQAISSRLFSSPLNTTSRSITHKANLMTPTWNLTLRTPQETLKRPQTTKEEEVIVRVEKQKLDMSTTISEKHLTGSSSDDHYRTEEEASSTASVSASEGPKAVDEPGSILTRNVKEDLQDVLKAEPGPVLFSANETAMITSPAGHPQTPESVSSSQHIEESKSSEDGDEEETEVSTEMAQISHAPVSAWEENETVIPEERDVVSELELESEDNTADNNAQEFRIDADYAELQLLGENSNKPASHLSADTFSPVEDDSEILTWADVKEDVIHFVEEESLKSAPEVERNSGEGNEEVEEKMEIEQAEWPGIEVLEGQEFDIKVQEEENETEQEKKMEQIKEEELTNGEEERVIEEEIGENFGEQKAALMMHTYEKGNLVGEKAELVMDTYEKDNPVGEKAKAVMDTFNKDQLVEHNAEKEQGQSDEDESLNISASWRTDPGEADSYAQENTIADTRPLIHYKSDEETDANIPISHLGVSEPTGSEDEREKHEGDSHWSQIIAKRFDTMEDLSEEPELGSMDDIVTDGSVQSVLRESMDEESAVQNESCDVDSHVKTLMDDALEDQSESDLRNNSNENSQGEEETKIEIYHLSTFLAEKQDESSQLHDWSASLYNETREMNEQQTLLTTQANISEDAITEYRDNKENWNIESIEINPEGEGEDKKYFDTPLPEPFQEQVLAEEPCEEPSIEITHSDVLLFETAITEEQSCPKEEDVQSNLSMLTHADFTDEVSLHSHPESQTNTNDSDLEETNSSEDESPNASQCSQLLSQQLDQDSATTVDVVSNTDPFVTGPLSGVLREESSEDYNAPEAEELENKEEQQYAVDSSSSGMGEIADSLPQEWENLGHEITSAPHSILSTTEEFGDVEMENQKDNMDIFQGDALKEECQTNEKENDLHSFFSSSIKEGIWSATKFEMAATYDPNDQTETETERYSYDSINSNQTTALGEDWGDLERLPPTNNKPEKDVGTSIAQSVEEEGEEQKMPQVKQVQCRDGKDGEEETVHAEDSTDEGDSWSSGEE